METPEELRAFYEAGYSGSGADAARSERWRALGARGKARRTLSLLADRPPATALLDVGCGDGALLAQLRAARPGWALAGAEIADAPARIARDRVPEAEIATFDGETLPWADGRFDVGVLSHVLEHVLDPVAALREAARACAVVVVEVPLEDNLSARRASKADGFAALGHLRRLARADVHRIAASAGLRVTAALSDPLGRDVHRFFASDARARARADAKWGARAALHRAAPAAAQRLFTVHYAARCEPR